MGSSLRKHARGPNQPIDITLPPTVSSRISRPAKGRTSNAQKQKADTCRNKRCGLPLQEMNSPIASNAHKGKHGKGGTHHSPTNARDWPVQRVNKKDEIIPSYKLNNFSYSGLQAATNNFSGKNLIGQGGFGDVYKGFINLCSITAAKPSNNASAIAIKRLRNIGPQGHDEWQNEMRFLSRLNHPNIVKLLGYCSDNNNKILVYEYMAKGSLETHLLRENSSLDWSKRIKIAVGAAKGLDYLHSCSRPVIHRDLKPSNILLEADYNAKLSDFGLARFGPQGEETHISTRVLGTQGYFAPEYIATGHLTLKTDIYSFGVVLLEMLCGCGAIRTFSNGMAGNLAQWAKPYLCNRVQLHRIIDKKLGRNICPEVAQDFAEIILQCLSSNPNKRPTMTQVLADLERLQQNMGSYGRSSYRTTHLRYLRNPKIAFPFH